MLSCLAPLSLAGCSAAGTPCCCLQSPCQDSRVSCSPCKGSELMVIPGGSPGPLTPLHSFFLFPLELPRVKQPSPVCRSCPGGFLSPYCWALGCCELSSLLQAPFLCDMRKLLRASESTRVVPCFLSPRLLSTDPLVASIAKCSLLYSSTTFQLQKSSFSAIQICCKSPKPPRL